MRFFASRVGMRTALAAFAVTLTTIVVGLAEQLGERRVTVQAQEARGAELSARFMSRLIDAVSPCATAASG